MRKLIQNKLKDQKGLTLIELLAVIVILAIIAAIAIPAIGNIINNSRVGAIKSDAQNALAAADLFLIDNPNHFDPNATTPETEIEMADLNPGYLDDQGSFADDAANFSITQVEGELVITGDGSIGGVTLSFDGANKATINELTNNAEEDDVVNETDADGDAFLGTVTVTSK